MWSHKIVIIFYLIPSILTQNDNKKDVEWTKDDERWNSKIPNWWDGELFVPPVGPKKERSSEFWLKSGQENLKNKLNQKLNMNIAKNLIIFIGDGMSLSTVMAARSYIDDVNFQLSFEKFPHVGLAKTYCINYQVPDSSCTATAILSGIKNNYGTIGVSGYVRLKECSENNVNGNDAISIFEYAQNAGKSTGVVTTTRLTHATPAAAYAHISTRMFEAKSKNSTLCPDIAHQLVHGKVGSRLNVAFGGGRRSFFPKSNGGSRDDERNLVDEFMSMHKTGRFLKNRDDLISLNIDDPNGSFLGLFAESHMQYKLLTKIDDRQPTLVEMVSKAIDILHKNENGFVLLVEGGRIDTGHHETKAKLALEETYEFHKAVECAKNKTDENETLTIVTSDHSSVLTVGGYMPRGYNILGPGDYSRVENKWFFSLNYANGPGHSDHVEKDGKRSSPQGKSYLDPNFRQPATVFDEEETHAGEDVAVYAVGPQSHLFTGVYEQNALTHLMYYATCLGAETNLKHPSCKNSGIAMNFANIFLLSPVLLLLIK